MNILEREAFKVDDIKNVIIDSLLEKKLIWFELKNLHSEYFVIGKTVQKNMSISRSIR